jgi:hypothetical protein
VREVGECILKNMGTGLIHSRAIHYLLQDLGGNTKAPEITTQNGTQR